MSVPALELEHVWVRVGGFTLRDISVTLDAGQVFVILGPSGAGKSVLLETIAGFYWPDRGRICIAGREVTRATPETRRVGFMLQDYALFPHLTVAQNISFGLRLGPLGAGQANGGELDGLIVRLDLKRLMERRPATLSGGEKQRVALARALATAPQLFLFDEPLSALDSRTRGKLGEELRTFLRGSGIAAVYVTHNQTEALLLADKMAIIQDGELLQIGTASEIFNTPVNEFVARFAGVENVIEGRVLSTNSGIATIELSPGQTLEAIDNGTTRSLTVLVCIRAENIALKRFTPTPSSVRNHFRGKIVNAEELGPLIKITLECGFPLLAYVTRLSYLDLGLTQGAEVIASVKASAIHLIGR